MWKGKWKDDKALGVGWQEDNVEIARRWKGEKPLKLFARAVSINSTVVPNTAFRNKAYWRALEGKRQFVFIEGCLNPGSGESLTKLPETRRWPLPSNMSYHGTIWWLPMKTTCRIFFLSSFDIYCLGSFQAFSRCWWIHNLLILIFSLVMATLYVATTAQCAGRLSL